MTTMHHRADTERGDNGDHLIASALIQAQRTGRWWPELCAYDRAQHACGTKPQEYAAARAALLEILWRDQ